MATDLKVAAPICESGPEFDFVAEDLWRREGRQYPVNAVVKITIEKVLPVRSPAYLFNDNIEEEAIRAVWLKRYGVVERDGEP